MTREKKEKMIDIEKNRFTEINEDGSKNAEEDLKGMPSFWLTIFQVLILKIYLFSIHNFAFYSD